MYKLEYLASAATDILEIDAYLYGHSPTAADKFMDSIEEAAKNLRIYPLMFPVYEDDPYFRHLTLTYGYRLFYHANEDFRVIKICRILHGMMDVKGIIESEG